MDIDTRFAVPVSNRFQILQGRKSDEQRKMQSLNISRQNFENSSVDNKLLLMFDELRSIRDEQANCKHEMINFQQTLGTLNEKLVEVIHTADTQSQFMKTLAYKSIDAEARSRRKNLIFRGLWKMKVTIVPHLF
jgi:hypothetical protein